MAESEEELKILLKVNEESENENAVLKLKIQKTKIIMSGSVASWEMCMQVKKQQLELDMEQQTGSK